MKQRHGEISIANNELVVAQRYCMFTNHLCDFPLTLSHQFHTHNNYRTLSRHHFPLHGIGSTFLVDLSVELLI